MQDEVRNVTPWVLVMANSTNLVANLMVRGPFASNAVLLSHKNVILEEFSGDLVSGLSKADGLMKVPYAGTVGEQLTDKE